MHQFGNKISSPKLWWSKYTNEWPVLYLLTNRFSFDAENRWRVLVLDLNSKSVHLCRREYSERKKIPSGNLLMMAAIKRQADSWALFKWSPRATFSKVAINLSKNSCWGTPSSEPIVASKINTLNGESYWYLSIYWRICELITSAASLKSFANHLFRRKYHFCLHESYRRDYVWLVWFTCWFISFQAH